MFSRFRIVRSAAAAPTEIVRRFNEAWAPGNIDEAMTFVSEDAVYNLHISGDLLPTGGQTVGRVNIEAALRKIREEFEYLLYRPLDLIADGNEVRSQVEFMFRHRRSGEVLSGRFRIIMQIENNLIVRADEYHDRAKVEAFLRLFTR
ncbi:MAG: nuclear transport factor 2 family protein [Hyphomicrobium sp.]|jgi:ketosteroid isomerase-like protein